LHDLGQCEVKHDVRVHIVNLFTEELGNPEPPEKFKQLRGKRKRSAAIPISPAKSSEFRWILIGAVVLIAGALAVWLVHRQGQAAKEIVGTNKEVAAMTAETTKMRQGIIEYPQTEAQIRGARAEKNLVAEQAEQERIYAQLGERLGIDPKVLREKLPRFADELKKAPNVSTYERANASYLTKDYVDAESLALRTAAETQESHPIDPRRLISALELGGLSAHRASQYERAMLHFRKAEGLTDRNRNLDEWVRLQREIADLLVAQGKLGEAEKLFRSLIELRARVLGPEHPDTLDRRHRLIYVLNRQTKFAEAEAEARDVLRLREKTLGPEHIDTNISRYYLAAALMNRGKDAEAESLYHKIIPLLEKALGPEHPRTLSARLSLATALGAQGKHAEAEPLYREIIRLDEKVYGPVDPDTLNARQNLATTLQAEHKFPEAEAEYRDTIKITQSMLGPEHPDILTSRNNLAELLDDQGKFAEAETECRQIIGLEEKVLGPENQITLNSRGNLAVALIGLGRFADAEIEYKDVLKRMERVLGLDHPDTLAYTTKFVTGLARQKKAGEAMKVAREMEDHARKALGPDNPSTQRYAKLVQDLGAPPNK
jgi:tetratricopeptide (TPR) repeat protein